MQLAAVLAAVIAAVTCLPGVLSQGGGEKCQLVIQPIDRPGNDIINLAEIRLYDLAGSVIPYSQLQVAQSTIFGNEDAGYGPGNCFDGNLGTICHTEQYPFDPNPSLAITYPCSGGSSAPALSKVEVDNRPGCCSDRITRFKMVFRNARGEEDAQPFYFSDDLPTYTIPVVAGGGEMCQLAIMLSGRSGNDDILPLINLADIRLYDLAGSVIPYSQLQVAQSTTWDWNFATYGRDSCFDRDLGTICATYYYPVDLNPTLAVTYPCSGGGSASALSKVEVDNRRDCCSERITRFRMVFRSARGVENAQPFFFSEDLPTYTIPVVAGNEASPPPPSQPSPSSFSPSPSSPSPSSPSPSPPSPSSPSPSPPSPSPPSPSSPSHSSPPNGSAACSADNLHWTSRQCCDAAQPSNNEADGCIQCVASVGEQAAYACVECTRLSWYPGVGSDCQQCVQAQAGKNMEWACQQVCYNPQFAASRDASSACQACYSSASVANAYGCADCLKNSVGLAQQAGVPGNSSEIEQARSKCLEHVQNGRDVWGGSACLKKSSLDAATACLDCLLASDKQTWMCTNA